MKIGDHPNVRIWGTDEYRCTFCKRIWPQNEPEMDIPPCRPDKATNVTTIPAIAYSEERAKEDFMILNNKDRPTSLVIQMMRPGPWVVTDPDGIEHKFEHRGEMILFMNANSGCTCIAMGGKYGDIGQPKDTPKK